MSGVASRCGSVPATRTYGVSTISMLIALTHDRSDSMPRSRSHPTGEGWALPCGQRRDGVPCEKHSTSAECTELTGCMITVEQALRSPRAPYTTYPCVCPGLDNCPRRPSGGATVSPSLYERWVRGACCSLGPRDAEEGLLFVNAWNEWGEGNHLEPCQRWGWGYLEANERATNEALRRKGSIPASSASLAPS